MICRKGKKKKSGVEGHGGINDLKGMLKSLEIMIMVMMLKRNEGCGSMTLESNIRCL